MEEWSNLLFADWMRQQLIVGAMVAARIGGMIVAMPMLTGGMPIRMRMVLVLMISMVVVPGLDATGLPSLSFAGTTAELAMAGGREFLFGMVIGGIAQLLITGISLAGELIASATGIQLAQTADPSSGQAVPQLSRLFALLVTAILFASGGYRMLIDALLTSFHQTPPLGAEFGKPLAAVMVEQLTVGFESGLKVAAPVLACVLLTNLVVAIISRTVPQLNALTIGMNLNVLAAITMLALTIGSAGLIFESELAAGIERLGSATAEIASDGN